MSSDPQHVCKPVAIGHSICCETCFAGFLVWSVTAPVFGLIPRRFEWNGIQEAGA
jgi:hypothetical protein